MRMLFDKEIRALRIEAALAGIRGTVNGELKHLWDDIAFAEKLVLEIEAGETPPPTPEVCGECGGLGEVPNLKAYGNRKKTCPTCDGTGHKKEEG